MLRLTAMLSLVGLAAWNPRASAADPAPPSSTAVQAAAPEKPPAAATANDARDKRLRSLGYRPELRHGETVYCRREAMVGSRFDSKVCGTAEDLDHVTKDSQGATKDADRHQTYPLGK